MSKWGRPPPPTPLFKGLDERPPLPPYLRVWMTAPPPPPYLRVWMSALPSLLSQGVDPALRPAIQAHSVTT